MSKFNSAFSPGLLMLIFGFFTSLSPAQAGESKAQLHLPWTLLNTRLQVALGANSSTVSTEIPSYQLDAEGIKWNLSSVVVSGKLGANSAALTSGNVGLRAIDAPIEMTIGQVAVDQIIERVVGGARVRVHLKANCGPLVLTQSLANYSSLFGLNWASGSPVATLQSFNLNWPAKSWQLADFKCEGPQGLPEILHEQIVDRLGDANEFRPLLSQFLFSKVTESIESSLQKIREPFAVSSGQAKHQFKIGLLHPIESGVLAEVTVTSPTVAAAPAEPVVEAKSSKKDKKKKSDSKIPEKATIDFAKLPVDRPALIGAVGLLDQIFTSEMAAQPYYFTLDLQANKSFHDLMQSRFLQFFVFADLMNYPKSNPFYLQLFRPNFSALTVADNGNLRTSFPLSGLVQSYRDNQWWTWLNLNGDTQAEVRLTIASGTLKYETALSNKGVKLEYGAVYKAKFKKSGSPPSSIASNALKGNQPALSGSVVWPTVDLGVGGQYKIDRLEWIDKSNFVLHWN